ncbi:MAG: methyltransferase [Pseudomonadota bacterium]
MTTTRDAFLGGRVMLEQPAVGYRAATDAVFLAAACPAKPGESVFDLGVGVGAASLCVAARVPGVQLTGLEVQPEYAALAERNAAFNAASLEVVVGDAARMPEAVRARSFDHVISNPPFFDPDEGHASDDVGRNMAFRESMDLGAWIDVAIRRLKPRGTISLIHRTERLGEMLTALSPRVGAVRILPLQSRTGRPAKRVILRGVKGSKAKLELLAPFTVHANASHEGDFTDLTEAAMRILDGGEAL